MRRGSPITETGLLLRDGHQLVLQIDGGGAWRLDAPPCAQQLVGMRVRVEGFRDGYDLIGVEWIGRATEQRLKHPKPFVRSWQFAAGAASMLALVALAIAIAATNV